MAEPHAHFSNANNGKSPLSCFVLRNTNVKRTNIAASVRQEKIMSDLSLEVHFKALSSTMFPDFLEIARIRGLKDNDQMATIGGRSL